MDISKIGLKELFQRTDTNIFQEPVKCCYTIFYLKGF